VPDVAQICSQCGWGFDTEALRQNACKKCKSAILVTSVAYLEKFEKPAIQKYIAQYTQALKSNPQDADALLAVGVCYLQLGLFDLADKFFHRLVECEPATAPGYYYLAICLFRGKRPRCAALGTVREAERLAATALELDPLNGRNDWLLAVIRHDYYFVNGMSVPAPEPDELIDNANQKHVDQLEVEQVRRLLKIEDTPLWARAKS
jgi:tetratricopeptide (TPR) repeat protein